MDIEQNTVPVSQPPLQPNIRSLILSDAANSETGKLRRTVFDTLVQFYPPDGRFSRQEKLVIKRFGIDPETVRMESQRRHEHNQKLLLTSRTIAKGCPLTTLESISFNYIPALMENGQIGLLVEPLHRKERTMRLLHNYGAFQILRQNILVAGTTYMLLETKSNLVDTTSSTTPPGDESMVFEPELIKHGITPLLSGPAWTGFSFCLAEQPLTARKLLVVHGVGTLLRALNKTGVLTIVEEQEFFATNSPYSMMAVVETHSDLRMS